MENLRVPLVLATVLLVVQLHCLLLGVVLGLLCVDEVLALGLSQTVNLEADGRSQKLLGNAVLDGLALLALLGLPCLHAGEGSSATEELVSDLGLVLALELIVSVLGIAYVV